MAVVGASLFPGLRLLNQQLDVGGNEFLFGEGLLAVDGGDLVGGGCGLHSVVCFAVAFALDAVAAGVVTD